MVGRAAATIMFGTALMGGAVACGGLLCSPAKAQFFGGLFDPPRPPSSVPGPPVNVPARPQQVQPAPNSQLLPPGPPPGRAAPIQSEDLPPPGAPARPGSGPVTTLPSAPGQQPGQPPSAGQRQGNVQQGNLQQGALQPGTPQQLRPGTAVANAPAGPPPPPEDVVTPPPPARITNPTAVFSGLDKITGRITAFDAAIGETVQFGALQVTARACYSRPPTETPLTDGFVEVDEVTLQGEVRRIFTGWMFAASPGLHAVEHAIYDVWLTDCKGGAQAVADAQPAAPAAAPPRQNASPQRQAAPQQPRQPAQGQPAQGQLRQTLPPQPGVFR
jgi:hypothetical protein